MDLEILVITDAVQQAINALIETARLDPISADDLTTAAQAQGDDLVRWKEKLDKFTMEIPIGYLVTYTHEQQPPGLCRHIAVSVEGGLLNLDTMTLICDAFGMGEVITKRTAVKAWPETYPSGRVALNILAFV